MVATSGLILVSLGHHPIAEVSYFQGLFSYGDSQRSYLGELGSPSTAVISIATSRGRPPMVAASDRILVNLGHHPIAEVSYFQGLFSYGGSQRSYLGEFGSPSTAVISYFQGSPSYGGSQRSYLGEFRSPSYSRGQLLPGVTLLRWQLAIVSR